MKKISILLILICFLCCGCFYEYHREFIDNTSEYHAVWLLPNRNVSKSSDLFPSSINDKKVRLFYCESINGTSSETQWQMILEIEYNDKTYQTELDRIQSLCDGSPVCGKNTYFSHPVFASVWNWNGCYEYAVVDEDSKTITYLYLQSIDKNDIIIDTELLPNGYTVEMDGEDYTVYS